MDPNQARSSMLMIMEYTLQRFNLLQASRFTMDRGKPSLVAPILVNMTKVKSPTILTILKSSKDSFHFVELNEMLKTIQKMLKGLKSKVLNPHF